MQTALFCGLVVLFATRTSRAGEFGPLVNERVISAGADEVWDAFTTREGMESWMVAHADIDLRIGGKIRTTYKKDAVLGDASTIENTILAFEPNRMLVMRISKAPEAFPFAKAVDKTWTVLHFEPISACRTRVRVVGLGFDETDESRQMRQFFEAGNDATLEHLQRKFESKNLDASSELQRTMGLLKKLSGDWVHEKKSPGGGVFRAWSNIRPSPDGMGLVSDGWLGDSRGMFYHGQTQVYRRSISEGGGLWFQNINEHGAVASGEVRAGSGDSVIWDWNVSGLDGSESSYHIELILESDTKYRMVMKERTASGKLTDRLAAEFNKVKDVPAEFRKLRTAEGDAATESASPSIGAFEMPTEDPSQYRSYLAHIHAAHSSLRLEEAAEAQAWLTESPEPFRGWEWRYLRAALDQSLSFDAITGGVVYSVAVSPDERWIAIGSADGAVRVWDATDRTQKHRLAGHGGAVYKIAISPDGKQIASASHDKSVRVWSAETGEQLAIFRKHTNPVAAVAVHPNGRIAASASYERMQSAEGMVIEGRVYLWDLSSGELIDGNHTLAAGVKPLSALDFSRDGRKLAAGSWEGAAFVWDLEKGGDARKFGIADEGIYQAVDAVALSSDGGMVAVGSKDHTVRVWNTASGESTATLRGHGQHVYSVAFSSDGRRLASGGADDTIRLWDTKDWSNAGRLRGHVGAVRTLAWMKDDKHLVSGGADGTLRKWLAPATPSGGIQMKNSDGCYASIFSPDMRVLYTCGFDGMIAVWDSETGERKGQWKAHDESCNTIAMTGDGSRLMSCSWDKTVKIWDTANLKLISTIENESGVYHAAISSDGRVVVAAQGKFAQIWDVASRQKLAKLEAHEAGIQSVAISPDGGRIATASSDKTVRLWKTDNGELWMTLTGHLGAVESVVFSADGTMLASAGHDGMVQLWDVTSGKRMRLLHQEDGKLYRVNFSPDGRRIVVAGDRVLIVDTLRGGCTLALRPHLDSVWFASFSPDGERLVSCSWDKSIAIMDARPIAQRQSASVAIAGELRK